MPATVDFRGLAFDAAKVDQSGKDIGRKVYWKLYSVENIVRVIVHSVLTQQVSAGWWDVAVDPTIQKRVAKFTTQYANQPWHSTPGRHEVYYLYLSDLNQIILANSHLFRPIIPDIDQWVSRIEQIRLPRNIVGHMNWPSATDRKRIDVFYSDVQALARYLAKGGTLALVTP